MKKMILLSLLTVSAGQLFGAAAPKGSQQLLTLRKQLATAIDAFTSQLKSIKQNAVEQGFTKLEGSIDMALTDNDQLNMMPLPSLKEENDIFIKKLNKGDFLELEVEW